MSRCVLVVVGGQNKRVNIDIKFVITHFTNSNENAIMIISN